MTINCLWHLSMVLLQTGCSGSPWQLPVITGGAGGIGREVSTAFARRGAHVVIADIDGEAASEVAAGIGAAEALQLDNTDSNAVANAASELIAKHGSIEVLVNTPAITYRRTALELSEEEYDNVIVVDWERTARAPGVLSRDGLQSKRQQDDERNKTKQRNHGITIKIKDGKRSGNFRC